MRMHVSVATVVTLAVLCVAYSTVDAIPLRAQQDIKVANDRNHMGADGSTTTTDTTTVPQPAANNEWDFLLFMQRWPGTGSCEGKPCTVPSYVDYFLVHGLWANRNDSSYPSFCPGPSFSASAIEPLKSELDKYWTDLVPNDGDGFWQHEWEKHGVCATSDPLTSDEYKFFNAALTLRKGIEIYDALKAAGIYASNDQTYSLATIAKVVKKAVGVTPVLACQSSNTDGGEWSSQQLYQVGLCVDKDLKPFQCDYRIYQGYYDKCQGDQVQIPEIQY